MSEITIERTGNLFSFSSSEFLVTFPNKDQCTLWSPPWHEFGPEEEEANALEAARRLWENKTYITIEDAKGLIKHKDVSRVEVVDQNERRIVLDNVQNVMVSFQDAGRTLKIFLKDRSVKTII